MKPTHRISATYHETLSVLVLTWENLETKEIAALEVPVPKDRAEHVIKVIGEKVSEAVGEFESTKTKHKSETKKSSPTNPFSLPDTGITEERKKVIMEGKEKQYKIEFIDGPDNSSRRVVINGKEYSLSDVAKRLKRDTNTITKLFSVCSQKQDFRQLHDNIRNRLYHLDRNITDATYEVLRHRGKAITSYELRLVTGYARTKLARALWAWQQDMISWKDLFKPGLKVGKEITKPVSDKKPVPVRALNYKQKRPNRATRTDTKDLEQEMLDKIPAPSDLERRIFG